MGLSRVSGNCHARFRGGWHQPTGCPALKYLLTTLQNVYTSDIYKDLVARIPENYQTSEVVWGKPVSKDKW